MCAPGGGETEAHRRNRLNPRRHSWGWDSALASRVVLFLQLPPEAPRPLGSWLLSLLPTHQGRPLCPTDTWPGRLWLCIPSLPHSRPEALQVVTTTVAPDGASVPLAVSTGGNHNSVTNLHMVARGTC